jgi:hypothetical protein
MKPLDVEDLDEGPHAVLQQAVVDLIDVGQIVEGVALLVFVVDAHFIMQDVVKADVTTLVTFLTSRKPLR